MNDLEVYYALAGLESKTLAGYINHVVTDARPPKRLKGIIEPWQRTLYDLLTPPFELATGHRNTAKRAAFVTAPRGHSKTSTVGQLLNWSLCYAKRPITATAAAADKDQANILLERMKAEASHNPYLDLTFKAHQVIGPTGTLDIISSDAPTSSGRLDDIIVFDELVWWKKRDLFDVLLSGRNKRPDSALVIISNSGVLGTWQHDLWKAAQSSPGWITHEVPAFAASWIDRQAVEEDRKLLLPSMFKRLHLNTWVDEAEENAFATRSQIEACIDRSFSYCTSGTTGHSYFVAIDYGSVNDRATACVCHSEGQRVILDKLDVWQGEPGRPVPVTTIDDWIDATLAGFKVRSLILDPCQMEATAQKFEGRVEVERYNFAGQGHYAMAENLRSLIINKRLAIYQGAGPLTRPDGSQEDLVDEVSQLVVVEKQFGRWRFDHLPGRHDDRATVLAMASLACHKFAKVYDWSALLDTYTCYQACPEVNGVTYRLAEYQRKEQAAYAVNCVHEFLNSPPPNEIAVAVPDAEGIRKKVVEDLTHRKITPPEKKKTRDKVNA